MSDVEHSFTVIEFDYKTRRWTAEITRCHIHGRLYYKVIYHPLRASDLIGMVEIVPPSPNGKHRHWKQHRRHLDEDLLNLEFINLLGARIQEWQDV